MVSPHCKNNLIIIINYQLFLTDRFHRGQSVYVEGKDLSRFSANISAIGTEAVSDCLRGNIQ